MSVRTPDPRTVPSRSIPALEWLRRAGLDDEAINLVTSMVPTWAAMTSLPMTTWVSVAGSGAARLTPPVYPPAPIPLPAGVVAVSRYGDDFPPRLHRLRHPPVLLYVRGAWPTAPTVGVVCGRYPTARGVEVVADGVRAAVAAGMVPVLHHTTSAGRAGALVAAEMGAAAVLVSPSGVDVFDADIDIVDRTVDNGGVWVSSADPAARNGEVADALADALLAGLSDVVLVAQAGLSISDGVAAVTDAISASVPLVVPDPETFAFGSPPAALASDMLANASTFAPDVLGTNATIARRVAAGMPAASAVVATPADLSRALADAAAAG